MKRLSFFMAMLTSVIMLWGMQPSTRQSTIRKIPKSSVNHSLISDNSDTITCGPDDMVLRGFHKPLRSRIESVFVTNNTSVDIIGLILDITYTDVKGRTLHQQRRTIVTDIPAGETRRIEFPSWDRQQVFYYAHSSEPPRADGTPFDVRCSVESIIVSTD